MIQLIYFEMAYSVTVPVSIHPVTYAKQHNEKKKQHRSNFSLLMRFCFFCTMFKRARTCPPSFPGEGEQKREGGGEDEERRGKKKREDTQLKQRPNQLLLLFSPLFRGWRRRKVGGLQNGRTAGFNVFPSCKVTPVDSQQPQIWILEIYSCDNCCRAPPVWKHQQRPHVKMCK